MMNALLGKSPLQAPLTGTAPSVGRPLRGYDRTAGRSCATLYRFAPANLAATAVLGTAMAVALDLSDPTRLSGTWLVLLLLLTGARLFHAMRWRCAELPPNLAWHWCVNTLLGAGLRCRDVGSAAVARVRGASASPAMPVVIC